MTKEQKNRIDLLKQDVEIPSVVNKKAAAALQNIRASAPDSASIHTFSGKSFPKKRLILAAAAMSLLIGTVSFAAVQYFQWSSGLDQELSGTDAQKQALNDKNISSYVGQSVTKDGVTITVTQSIVDSYFARVAFKIEGYSVPEGKEPCFKNISTSVNGVSTEDMFSEIKSVPEKDCYSSNSGFFYDGEDYVLDDGSLEYDIYFSNTANRDFFINSPIHIQLQGLGYYDSKLNEYIEIDDSWSFDWTLQGADEIQEYDMSAPLEDTGITVTHVEISPISMKVVYDYPKGCNYTRPDGENEQAPPFLTGVKMKDGTLYPYICDMGSEDWAPGKNSSTYTSVFTLTQILDVENVDSLLFVKSYVDEGETPTEANFYQVPLQ